VSHWYPAKDMILHACNPSTQEAEQNGFELRALKMQSRWSTTWAKPPVYFALVILEMGYCELLAWAGLEPQSFWSQPPKKLGLQAWDTVALPGMGDSTL
jgi:hypothetical protein